jgi:PhzF family phenazine biosynthesis protein
MPAVRFKQVDVFTQKPFWGNPVAVVIDSEELNSEDMQRVAAWTNLSETTFVLPPTSEAADYRLRIFTTKQELPFAGHPTIGSAHAIIESGLAEAKGGKLRQECLAGILDLRVEETHSGEKIMVQAPPARVTPVNLDVESLLTTSLRAPIATEWPPLRVDVGVVWLVANLGSAERVANLKPDMVALARLSGILEVTGVTVFGNAKDDASALHVRSFAPMQGVAEDPVCGSGNASVAAFLRETDLTRIYGTKYTARQGMQVGRAGNVDVQIDGESIWIGGYAVTCVDGTLRLN